jgi:mono/diheme cytochrome c family protein
MSQRALAGASPQASHLATPSAAELADGERQLHVLGCANCHGPKLQGEIFIDEPKLAKVYAPNLTLIAAKASDAQLDQAIRQGIGHDGRALVIMPSEGYQFLTDAETAALIAAIRALPRGRKQVPPRRIGPKARLGLALGKFHTTPELIRTFRAARIPDFGPSFARGRHIVETNCAECHGPQLHGQEVEPGVVSADLQIAGAYDLDQFRALLRTGVAPGNKDIGLMGRVAKDDFKYLTDEEIAAIHAYLVERARRMP